MEIGANRKETASDRKEIKAVCMEMTTDRMEIDADHKEMTTDRKEIASERLEIAADCIETHRERKEIRTDCIEIPIGYTFSWKFLFNKNSIFIPFTCSTLNNQVSMNSKKPKKKRIHYLYTSFKIASVKPAYLRGLRVAFLLAVPVLFGFYTNQMSVAFAFMLASLNVSLIDMGGNTYSKTARLMLITTLLNAIAVVVAQYAGTYLITAVFATAVWLMAVAMLGLLGNAGVLIAFVNSALFVMIVAKPDMMGAPLDTLFIFILGGFWAMLLSLIAWPIRPYQPVRKAVAACYQENASFLRSAALYYQEKGTYLVKKPAISKHSNFRQKIDAAHAMLSHQRQGRYNRSDAEDALIILLQGIARDHRSILVLLDWLNKSYPLVKPEKSEKIYEFLMAIAEVYEGIAELILHSKIPAKPLFEKVVKIEINYVNSKNELTAEAIEGVSRVLERILANVKNEIRIVAQQNPDFSLQKISLEHDPLMKDEKAGFFTLLRDSFSIHSAIFRHALRIGITSALAVFLAAAFNLPRGYWMPLTVVVIMAPDFGGAFMVRTIQRGVGTILGGLFAVLLLIFIHHQIVVLAMLLLLTIIAISLQPINYALFVFFLTPLIVVMYSISGTADWHIPFDRVLDTLAGMLLAIIGSHLLLPVWERHRFPAQLSKLLEANAIYFEAILAVFSDADIDPKVLRKLNRNMELAASNTRASIQRSLNQPGLNQDLIAPMLRLQSASARFMQSSLSLHYYVGMNAYKQDKNQIIAKAGIIIIDLLKSMSATLLMHQKKDHQAKSLFLDAFERLEAKADELDVLLANITAENHLYKEFQQLAELERNMMFELINYLSIFDEVPLPETASYSLA